MNPSTAVPAASVDACTCRWGSPTVTTNPHDCPLHAPEWRRLMAERDLGATCAGEYQGLPC